VEYLKFREMGEIGKWGERILKKIRKICVLEKIQKIRVLEKIQKLEKIRILEKMSHTGENVPRDEGHMGPALRGDIPPYSP
jgi:hypothetical protein